MLILLVLILMVVVGICILDKLEVLSIAFISIGGVCLLIAMLALIINPLNINSSIAEFDSVRKTLNQARQDKHDLEVAAIQHKIVDSNKWLASQKYWNSTLFDIWIPDEIEKLEPIK